MSGETILVVDDNASNAKIARIILSGEGFDVRTAAAAEDALAFLETATPDAILLDIHLPHMSGLELARRLREDPRFDATTIVAFTAGSGDVAVDRLIASGCDGSIAKPIDARSFAATVRSALRESAHSVATMRDRSGSRR